MPARTGLRRHDWPAADRAAWDAGFADDDVFERGAGAQLGPRTRAALEAGYARWLGFIAAQGTEALHQPPAARITPQRLRDYVAALGARCRPTTVWSEVKCVYDVARFIAPVEDWSWLRRAKANLERRKVARPAPVIDSGRLAGLGFRLMEDAVCRLAKPGLDAARDYRDGLIIALLVHRPLRRRTMAGLRIGPHLQKVGQTWMLVLEPEDMKNHRHAEFSMPDELVPWLERYLTDVRLRFPGAGRHDGLWASSKGGPMTGEAIYDAVRKHTAAAFGIALNLHAVRHSDATTIARHAPEDIAVAAPLLTHADPRTTERYYNTACALDAGRAHAQIVDTLRRKRIGKPAARSRERRTCAP